MFLKQHDIIMNFNSFDIFKNTSMIEVCNKLLEKIL